MLIKTNMPGYLKDDKTNLVMNLNPQEYSLYLAEKQRHESDKLKTKELNKLEEDMKNLSSEVEQIKDLLTQILHKVK
jgi:hypothetical protein